MLSPTNQAVTFWFFFAASKLGKSGLTVTVDVARKGSGSLVVSAASATAGLIAGSYYYTLASGSTGNADDYFARATTTDTSVDARDVPSLWIVGGGMAAGLTAPAGQPHGLAITTRRSWYLSPNGNDANDGLSEATPKQTFGSLTCADKDVIELSAGTHVMLATFDPGCGVTIRGKGKGVTFLTDDPAGTYTGDAPTMLLCQDNVCLIEDLAASNNSAAIYLIGPGGGVSLTVRRCKLSTSGQDLISGSGSYLIEDSELLAGLASDTDVVVNDSGSLALIRTTIVSAQCTNVSCPVYMDDCDLNGVVGLKVGGANTATIVNTRIKTKTEPGNTTAEMSIDSPLATVNAYGCDFDRTKVSVGTLVDAPKTWGAILRNESINITAGGR